MFFSSSPPHRHATARHPSIFEHQDSHGGGGVITHGDTQWMTAGGGLLHIKQPPKTLVSGGLVYMLSGAGAVGADRRPVHTGPSRLGG
jgi:hypothetical protein